MGGRGNSRAQRALFAVCAGALLALPLTACAPEPGTDTGNTIPESVAGIGGKEGAASDGKGGDGESWPERDTSAELPKSTTLPDSFPVEQFRLPDGVIVDDAGARSDTAWFVVLRAQDATVADALWNEIIARNGFTAAETTATAEGGVSAQLTGAGVSALGITIPQEDGQVLLSYDIELAA